jgi:hypothetical protein
MKKLTLISISALALAVTACNGKSDAPAEDAVVAPAEEAAPAAANSTEAAATNEAVPAADGNAAAAADATASPPGSVENSGDQPSGGGVKP